MSAYSAVAAAYRYADKESLLLRQAIQGRAGRTMSAASSEKTQTEVKAKPVRANKASDK